jgi:peptidoglycan/LPS O-acetylase OafA/YrhL
MQVSGKPVPKIDALTGVRAFAALWVVLYHIKMNGTFHFVHMGWIMPFVKKGYLGVDLFFLLSGIVICYVYEKTFQSLTVKKYASFIAARFTRIYPVHFLMLFMILLMFWLQKTVLHSAPNHPTQYNIYSFVLNVLNIHSWNLLPYLSWNMPSWSVSAEWFAYLLAPLIGGAICRIKNVYISVALFTGLAAFLYLFFRNMGFTHIDRTYDYGLIRIMTEFPMGCIVYTLSKTLRIDSRVYPVLALSAFAFVFSLPAFKAADINYILGFSACLFILFQARGWVNAIFANRIATHVGEISYSLYMAHGVALVCMEQLFKRLGWANQHFDLLIIGSVLFSSLLLAQIVYSMVETPARLLLRKKLDVAIEKISLCFRKKEAVSCHQVVIKTP